MKKVIIAFVLIVSTLAISLFGACSVFDKIDSAFNDILGGIESEVESKEEPSNPSSEKESANIDNESNKESESVEFNPLADKLVLVYGGVDYGSQKGLKLVKGSSYSFKLEVRTADGDVLEDCNNFKITKIAMQGRIVAKKETITNGTVTETSEEVINFENGEISFIDSFEMKVVYEISTSDFITAEISQGYLNITAKGDETDILLPKVPVRTGVRFTYLREYYDPRGGGVAENVSWYVYVEEVSSGKGQILYLDY